MARQTKMDLPYLFISGSLSTWCGGAAAEIYPWKRGEKETVDARNKKISKGAVERFSWRGRSAGQAEMSGAGREKD
jgi:hypothetical protein